MKKSILFTVIILMSIFVNAQTVNQQGFVQSMLANPHASNYNTMNAQTWYYGQNDIDTLWAHAITNPAKPGGNNSQVQYNNNGVLGGMSVNYRTNRAPYTTMQLQGTTFLGGVTSVPVGKISALPRVYINLNYTNHATSGWEFTTDSGQHNTPYMLAYPYQHTMILGTGNGDQEAIEATGGNGWSIAGNTLSLTIGTANDLWPTSDSYGFQLNDGNGNLSWANPNVVSVKDTTPATGNTVHVTTGYRAVIIHGVGTLPALTITLPSSPVNGQLFTISGEVAITTLTLTGGTTLTSYTSLSTSTPIRLIYSSVGAEWDNF